MTKSTSRTFQLNKLTASIALMLFAGQATMLSAEEADEEKSDGKIVVTAQKRQQDVMDVPIAIDAISDEELKDTGSILLGDVADYTPGFKFSKDGVAQAGANMRGVSSPNISTGGDPSTAVFFDGFYMPRAAQSVIFSDLARIEVLKGPQGTLFGRNAAVGAVNIIPNLPSDHFEGFVKLKAGNYGLTRMEGMLNVPISDDIAIRINAISNERDSYTKNVYADYDGIEMGSREHHSARISLLWDITEQTNVQLSYDWDDMNNGYAPGYGVSEYAYSLNPADRIVENDAVDGHETRDMTAVSFKLNHEFNENWSGKFITTKREWEVSGRDDGDGTADPTRYFDTINFEDSNISYHELQVNYSSEKINAVFGATQSSEEVFQNTAVNTNANTIALLTTNDFNNLLVGGLTQYGYTPGQIAGFGLPAAHIWNPQDWASILSVFATLDPGVAGLLGMLGEQPFSPTLPLTIAGTGDLTYDAIASALGINEVLGPSFEGRIWGQDITNTGDFTSTGFYADVDYQINDKWGIAAGVRYSKDEKDFSWMISERDLDGRSMTNLLGSLFPLIPGLNASDSWDKVTGRLITRYNLDDDRMVYLSYSTGYKSGGFDSLDPSTAFNPIEPETVSNIELGFKGDLVDDSVRFLLNVFDMQVDNRQRSVNSKLPDSDALIPLVINGDQTIRGAEMIVDVKLSEDLKIGFITEYRDVESVWDPFYNSEGVIETDRSKGSTANNYTVTFDWYPNFNVGTDGTWKIHVDYVFEENTAASNPGLLPVAYQIPGYFNDREDLNARISWTNSDGSWEFALWGKNIENNTTIGGIGGFAATILGVPTTSVNSPRTTGIDVNYHF